MILGLCSSDILGAIRSGLGSPSYGALHAECTHKDLTNRYRRPGVIGKLVSMQFAQEPLHSAERLF